MSTVHWVALALAGRVGGKTITRLFKRFASLEAALSASADDLMSVPHIGAMTAESITRIDLAHIEQACARFDQAGIRITTWQDLVHYPHNLLLCDDAPSVLFMRGLPIPADSRAVAIIGTRTPRPESATLAHSIGYELAARGWTIVSGLALGIDAAAHEGALAANGRTIAVLGSGLMRIYPAANHDLAHRIAKSGALISELHPDEKPSAQNLIARNRITSGLSRAVIVVQSGADSGSMNTARRAREHGRAVFAVLGGDSGCEELLASGAHPIAPDAIDYDALSQRIEQHPLTLTLSPETF